MRTFCAGMRLRCPKPKRGYPLTLLSLADHLRKRRLDLGLTQKDAGAQIGVDPDTVRNWENARTEVEVRFYPALISFLGYNPLPEAGTRGQAIRRARLTQGLSQEHLARLAGVDEGTVRRLEADTPRMRRRPTKAVCGLFGLNNWT